MVWFETRKNKGKELGIQLPALRQNGPTKLVVWIFGESTYQFIYLDLPLHEAPLIDKIKPNKEQKLNIPVRAASLVSYQPIRGQQYTLCPSGSYLLTVLYEYVGTLYILHMSYYVHSTGCTNTNSYISFCSGGQKYASQFWFEGDQGILNSGFFTYDPWIWSKVTSLSSTASKRKCAKNQ